MELCSINVINTIMESIGINLPIAKLCNYDIYYLLPIRCLYLTRCRRNNPYSCGLNKTLYDETLWLMATKVATNILTFQLAIHDYSCMHHACSLGYSTCLGQFSSIKMSIIGFGQLLVVVPTNFLYHNEMIQ